MDESDTPAPDSFTASDASTGAPRVTFEPALAGDAEALVELRIAAMRESLERVGRFDPQRARDRFRAGFDPALTRHLAVDGERVGFVVVRPQDYGLLLDHLYIVPSAQRRGIGAAALAEVLANADARRLPVRVGALRESDANRFYSRQGFELVEQAEWDNFYQRPVPAGVRAEQSPSPRQGVVDFGEFHCGESF